MMLETESEIAMKKTQINTATSFFLNAFRVIAAYAVLLGHGFSFFQITILRDQQYFPYIQNIGVVFLFMLSGFLIAYSLESRKGTERGNFKYWMIERFGRFYSAYLPALVFTCLVDLALLLKMPEAYRYHSAYNLKTLVGNVFLLQDIPYSKINITSFGSARQLWTLAVEWWLYIPTGYLILNYISRLKDFNVKISSVC